MRSGPRRPPGPPAPGLCRTRCGRDPGRVFTAPCVAARGRAGAHAEGFRPAVHRCHPAAGLTRSASDLLTGGPRIGGVRQD